MIYKDFSLDAVIQQFGLDVRQESDLFASDTAASISDLLRQTLAGNIPLAVDIGTEKARSEFIIAPILAEVRRQAQPQVSLFSGVEFNVDVERGLRGVCDFLFSLSPLQLAVQARSLPWSRPRTTASNPASANVSPRCSLPRRSTPSVAILSQQSTAS